MPYRRYPQRTRGSALTEFAILVPVMIAMIYGSIYLGELGTFKLKTQEIARFAAWSLAVRPLSDFDAMKQSAHRDVQRDSIDAARDELTDMYLDLDGTRTRVQLEPGRSALATAAVYEPAGVSDLRADPIHMVPSAIDYNWSDPDGDGVSSTLGTILQLAGVGGSVGDLFAGPMQRLGLNRNGQVRGRARVHLVPPFRADHQELARALAAQGRIFRTDLSRWNPSNRRLRDVTAAGAREVETVLVAEDWRMPDGASAHPGKGGPYAKAVRNISDDAIKALPGGPLISLVLNTLFFNPTDPPGLGDLFGFRVEAPEATVFARPYTQARESRPSVTSTTSARGQVNVVRDTEASDLWWEDGGVRNHETLPLYIDETYESDLLDDLNGRGRGFLGCPEEQERRCEY